MMQRAMTVEDLWALPRVGAPVPCPDGRRIVVPVTTWSMETNESETRLWLVEEGARPRALTAAGTSASQPAISPDGTRLLFVRKPGGAKIGAGARPGAAFPDVPQVHVMSLDGGEAERLTDLPLGIADPRWFPDGRRVAFLVTLLADAPTVEGTARLHREREQDPVKVRVTEDRVYRFWDRWLTDGRIHHLFALDLDTRAMTDLLPGSKRWFDLMDPSDQYRIAPDGREIAFAASKPRKRHDPPIWGIWTVSLPARLDGRTRIPAPRCLTPDHPADCIHPVYSPDGRWIVFGMQREPDFYADRRRLTAHERRTGRQTVLTEDWDRSAAAWAFSENGRALFVTAEEDARTSLFTLDLAAALRASRRRTPLLLARGGTFGAPFPAGGRIFTTLDTLTSPPEAVAVAADGGSVRRWTAFTADGRKSFRLGRIEEDHFRGADGDRVQMFLVHPPGAPKRGRRPLVHLIHGGPHGAFGDNWHWRWCAHLFAAPGNVVALVNFHGSTSWGQRFAACIHGGWGGRPYEDLMAATDRLIARGIADPRRMAATGGSYGGFMTSWIAARTRRFACLVNHAGVCDFQTQWASDVTDGWKRSLGGTPWVDRDLMDRFSPMRHADGFHSPMLVIHGERDYRVPYDQGLAIYNVYRAKGRPARLVCYPDENHWVLKPRNSRHWYGEVLGWLDRWIGKGRRRR